MSVSTMSLTDLMAKVTAGNKLTAAEQVRFSTLLAEQQVALSAARNMAKEAGVTLATKEEAGKVETMVDQFIYQWEGVAAWRRYCLLNAKRKYNELATKHKLPICTDHNELAKLIDNLPAQFTAAVTAGKEAGRIRYNKQWTKELAKLAVMELSATSDDDDDDNN